jgi:nucleobase transporter 1/2
MRLPSPLKVLISGRTFPRQTGSNLIYGLDDIPPLGTAILLGLQHYVAMVGALLSIPLILSEPLGMTDASQVAALISTIFCLSGVVTLLQTTVGSRLPIVQGGSFAFLAPAVMICKSKDLQGAPWRERMCVLQGAFIAGSLLEMAIGFSGVMGRLLRFLSPVSIAPTIALVGLSLTPIGAVKAGGDWLLGGSCILLVILFSQFLPRKDRLMRLAPVRWCTMFPVLGALALSWSLAGVLTLCGHYGPGDPGYTDFSSLERVPWVTLPYPFQWGWPIFRLDAALGMVAGFLASVCESIGDYHACARIIEEPPPSDKTINLGIGMEGVGCLLEGIWGTGNGTTSYSENIGVLGFTRVGSRHVIRVGASLLVLLGIFSKYGGVFATIPGPVVGGLWCTMFGMIAAVGLSSLQHVDLNSPRNLFTVGFALFMGLALPAYTDQQPISIPGLPTLDSILNALLGSAMTVGLLCGLILDNVLPGTPEERGIAHWRRTPAPGEDYHAWVLHGVRGCCGRRVPLRPAVVTGEAGGAPLSPEIPSSAAHPPDQHSFPVDAEVRSDTEDRDEEEDPPARVPRDTEEQDQAVNESGTLTLTQPADP